MSMEYKANDCFPP
ncbi:hypothetical protein PHET_10637 [Paragonimus heterotremus]|uniref:Uncharacterized protein n=1 Tax=Paragonimus heterotremus TaxID=100268 RepID=A0A8J4WEA1_9TREM|nr:hypothetical protein PHET_10637 [Paragonimus heterotremus]